MKRGICLLITLVMLCTPWLSVSAGSENDDPDAYLVAHWDFEEDHIYTDNLTRIRDVAVGGSYGDLMSAQDGATVQDGVGIVKGNAKNVFVSYHTSNLATDVTNFAAMTAVMKMKVDTITGTAGKDFFDITKNNLYSIRCLFIPKNDGKSFQFQVTTLSTESRCGGATWSSAGESPVIVLGADQWFYFAVSHEFDSENHSVTTVYYSIDEGKTFTKYITLVSNNAFTEDQIAAATTEAPTLQNLTFGKYQWDSYPAQAQGYAFEDIRIYKTVLNETSLQKVAADVEESLKEEKPDVEEPPKPTINPVEHLIAHWDFEEESIYTDNLTRVNDIAPEGDYNDRLSAQDGAVIRDGVGIVTGDAKNVFVSYHNSNLADVTNFAALTAVIKMKVDAITGTASGDFFDITKDNLYSIRCLFIPQSDGQSFKFQVTTLSTAANCGGATWSSAWAATPSIPLGADQWFYFAMTHEFDSKNHSVTTVYYSIDNGKSFVKYLTLVSNNVFTEEQIIAATTAAPTLQNLTFGKCQLWDYPAQAQGYAFEDIRMYNAVLDEETLKTVASDVEKSIAGHRPCEHEISEEITVVTPSTCTAEGVGMRICALCDTVLEENIALPKLDHTDGETVAVTQPTCSSNGIERLLCGVCGETIRENASIPKTAHTPGEWIIDSPAQIGVSGKRHKECSVCHEVAVIELLAPLAEEETVTPEDLLTTQESESETMAETESTTDDGSLKEKGGCMSSAFGFVSVLLSALGGAYITLKRKK